MIRRTKFIYIYTQFYFTLLDKRIDRQCKKSAFTRETILVCAASWRKRRYISIDQNTGKQEGRQEAYAWKDSQWKLKRAASVAKAKSERKATQIANVYKITCSWNVASNKNSETHNHTYRYLRAFVYCTNKKKTNFEPPHPPSKLRKTWKTNGWTKRR